MTLIPVDADKKTIAFRFRKAHSFAFLDEGQIIVQENLHKTSKSPEFFEYFKTLNIDTLYIKELGYKTFLTLLDLGVEVYVVEVADTWNRIKPNELLLLTKENAKEHCSLGHQSKEDNV
jgi:predicted Fe-Mo cluster-binding NifX family protein